MARCYSTGVVNGADCVGGLVACNENGSATQCYSTAKVRGSTHVGGLVGFNYGALTQCYSTGAVSGSGGAVGGLVGHNYGTVTQSYSTSAVGGSGGSVGGLVGSNGGAVADSRGTGPVSGSGGSVGGLVGSNAGPVAQCHSAGPVSGSGGSIGGLAGSNTGRVTQCYSTAGVNGTSIVGGLVGDNSGSLTHCYSTGAVRGSERGVGGLVGSNGGTVSQCYSTGPISGSTLVGGLAGHNHGTMSQCFGTGAVGGSEYVGGLVGSNWGNVTYCYSTGGVIGDSAVGGLVGGNGGGLDAPTGTVSNCFWDTQTSGQATSASGTGKTTAEMQMARTFLEVGWDFVGETANGTEDLWWIREGKDYARLAWDFWALSPVPANGATYVIQSPTLRWLAGRSAVAHDVYFSEDKTVVADATPTSLGIYRGRQPAEAVTYDPGALEWGRTYYWRVDEVNEANPNSVWKGSIWTFSTSDIPIVGVLDDIESYTESEGNRIYETWIDGSGPGGNVPGNGTNSVVGNMNSPFAEQTIVRGGKQSMPMDYNNVKKPWYSEAQRTWVTPQDWTIDGVDTLTLYFRGKADNGREPLYVGIEDSAGRIAVVVHPDAEAVRATEWQKWHIALAEVRAAGVDVAAVKKMVIGVGDRKNARSGGTGRIYIDDIRLTKRMP